MSLVCNAIRNIFDYLRGTVITLQIVILVLCSCIFSIWEVVLVWKKENKSKLLACLLPVEKPKGRSPFDKKNVIRKWTLDSTCTIVSRGVKRFIIVILFQIVVPLFFVQKNPFFSDPWNFVEKLCWPTLQCNFYSFWMCPNFHCNLTVRFTFNCSSKYSWIIVWLIHSFLL